MRKHRTILDTGRQPVLLTRFKKRNLIMKAMQINTYGEDAKFELANVDKPEVKAGHILVKIAASSVNTVDTMIRKMG